MHKVVTPALFWCSSSWNLRADQYTKLRGVQRSMLRQMLHFRKAEHEGIHDFMRRTEGIITNLMSNQWQSSCYLLGRIREKDNIQMGRMGVQTVLF